MKIGVLALQGAFREHSQIIESLGHEVIEVRMPEHLEGLSGLVIPGGESTAIGKLMVSFNLVEAIKAKVSKGMAVFGTCAGLILLADTIVDSDQTRLGLIDMVVKRNAYGRQIDSFEIDLEISGIEGGPMKSVFIRAPYIESVGVEVEILATYQEKIVCVRQDRCLAAAFHPELTSDTRIHQFFLSLCE